MPEAATYSFPAKHRITAPPRKLMRIQEPHFLGWGCSACAWVFKPSGPPTGNSLDEMMEIFKRGRDKEFAIHVCAEQPRAKRAQG